MEVLCISTVPVLHNMPGKCMYCISWPQSCNFHTKHILIYCNIYNCNSLFGHYLLDFTCRLKSCQHIGMPIILHFSYIGIELTTSADNFPVKRNIYHSHVHKVWLATETTHGCRNWYVYCICWKVGMFTILVISGFDYFGMMDHWIML